MSNDSVSKTLTVAFVLCLVCSVLVSAAAIALKPLQEKNKAIDLQRNILMAAGLYQAGVDIEEQFKQVNVKVVDLEKGTYTDSIDLTKYDSRKALKDPDLSAPLSADQDKAKIKRLEKYGLVYVIEKNGQLEKMILPVRGYGLWSTLYGFIALEKDLNTVAGLGFYQHGETPGLGGEVDNPKWKALWPGKKVYQGDQVGLSVIKGRSSNEFEVDGLSGATLTSVGVHNLVQFWLGEQGYQKFLRNLTNRPVSQIGEL